MVKSVGSEVQQIEVLSLLMYDLVKLITSLCFSHLLNEYNNTIFPQL